MFRCTLAVLAASLIAVQSPAEPLNVLFYGNSFTLGFGSTSSVNALFEDIAIAAGHEAPLVQSGAVSGRDLNWHVNNNVQIPFTLLPPDREWDAVVMQEHSTKLTRVYPEAPFFPDSIEESKADAIALYNAVKARSAGVTPVLYETWARGFGHQFYAGNPPAFPNGPSEMQAEIRAGYDMLKDAIDADVGAPTAVVAPVGDAWEAANFDNLHSADLWHAGNRGTLLAALVIYGTVYEDATTSDIDLSSVLTSLNLTAADGAFLTAAADATLRPIPEPSAAVLAALLSACLAGRRGVRSA